MGGVLIAPEKAEAALLVTGLGEGVTVPWGLISSCLACCFLVDVFIAFAAASTDGDAASKLRIAVFVLEGRWALGPIASFDWTELRTFRGWFVVTFRIFATGKPAKDDLWISSFPFNSWVWSIPTIFATNLIHILPKVGGQLKRYDPGPVMFSS